MQVIAIEVLLVRKRFVQYAACRTIGEKAIEAQPHANLTSTEYKWSSQDAIRTVTMRRCSG